MADFADQEILVHRFLDQDLSAEERLAFIVRLGRDERLRERIVELERLALDAGRLPRPDVPPGFVRGVMERLEPPPPAWRRLADALLAPRSLRWNFAGAAAVAAAAILAVWIGASAARNSPAAPTGPVSAAGGPAAPLQASPVLVRLIVVQPGAMSVHVAGDFNGWSPSSTPLERTPGGDAWTVMLPLAPGRYEYQFVVDGNRWLADPFAAEDSDDGFGSRNAVLDVRAPMVAARVS
jgi:hypothetical protein